MDGMFHDVIIGTVFREPAGLTLDFEMWKLYVVDAFQNFVGMSNPDGTGLTILPIRISNPLFIDYFLGSIYIANLNTLYRVIPNKRGRPTQLFHSNREIKNFKPVDPSHRQPSKKAASIIAIWSMCKLSPIAIAEISIWSGRKGPSPNCIAI